MGSFLDVIFAKIVDGKLSKTAVIVILLVGIVITGTRLFAIIVENQSGRYVQLDGRVRTIELQNIGVCTKLESIDKSLQRIEFSQEAMRKDTSDLKLALINKYADK